MSLFDLQKAWHQAVDEAQMSRSDRSAMAAHELRACAGIHTRSAIRGGQCMATTFGTMDEGCPQNAQHSLGTAGTGVVFIDACHYPEEYTFFI